MQAARLPLLRLGWQFQRHEVGIFQLLLHLLDNALIPSSAFLKQLLRPFAAQHPQIEIHVSPRPSRHPVIRGTYINGREKAICVKNLEREQVLQKVELLRDASGEKVRRVKGGRVVTSINESIRGIWSPMHGAKSPILD